MQKSSSNAGAKPRSKTPPPARSGNAAMTPLRRVAEAANTTMTPPPAGEPRTAGASGLRRKPLSVSWSRFTDSSSPAGRAGPGAAAERSALPGKRELGSAARKVCDFMVPAARAVTCLPGDHLGAAVRAMVDERIGCCVVVESIEGGGAALRPLGVVTKSDVCRAFLAGHSPDSALVDVLPHAARGEGVRCVGEAVECAEAAEYLEASGVRHLVVKNSVGAFVGLVTAWDITRELALDTRASWR